MPPTPKTNEPQPEGETPGAHLRPLPPAPGGRTSAPTERMAPVAAPTAMPVLGGAAGDRCAACGSPMAGDQRYCLACGERRGQARFTPQPPTASSSPTVSRTRVRPAQRISAGTTLIAGVGTLLLAMGIGVFIGRENAPAVPANSKVQVVNLGGAGATAATTAGTPAGKGSAGKSNSKSKSKHGHKAAKPSANVSAANASTTVKNLPPPTVTVGAKGHGPGYTHGHFTGTFFGP